MPLKNFKSYNLAVRFYREASRVKGARHLIEQLDRASSSIALNLSEGSAKPTQKDRVRYYFIALGSQRECSAILDLINAPEPTVQLCRELGACIYALAKSPRS